MTPYKNADVNTLTKEYETLTKEYEGYKSMKLSMKKAPGKHDTDQLEL